MFIVAVDLAAKYSAACLMGENLQPQDQWDSWACTEATFIAATAYWFHPEWDQHPEVMVVEDLPHRLPFSGLVKTVCRIQGRLVGQMSLYDCIDRVLFVPPAEWRKTYKGLERGTGPDAVLPVAASLGYTPPDLSERAAIKGGKAIARKVATDYAAAFLIGRWAHAMYSEHGTFDVVGTSRYAKPPIRKERA